MCGIVGVFNAENAVSKVEAALEVLKSRGNDNKDVYIKANSCIGHCLHSVVSFVKQPIIGKGVLAANCEIYNWMELNNKYSLNAGNDAELLLKLLDKKGISIIEELDGDYAFAYWLGDDLYVARDSVGVKPVWYSHAEGFAFASEKKALENIGFVDIVELNPRKILKYNVKNNNLEFVGREFFKLAPLINDSEQKIKKKVDELLTNSVKKRIPDKKLALLFSGGVDSTTIGLILQKLGKDFTCYTCVLDSPDLKTPEDLVYAEKVAKEYGFKLKIIKIKLSEVKKYLKIIIPLIEDSNVVKAGVALTFFAACEQAKKDGCKVILSGLGSEEIFAGYKRHKDSSDVNKECYSGLLKMYERDLYRDDVITMYNSLELRVPFLDKELISYCLRIMPELKLKDGVEKYILRLVASDMGLQKEFAFRKKKAAQYGSNFDKAIGKLAKEKYKSEYLRQFYPKHNLKLGVLFSSGKDSNYALYVMQRQNYKISCLITLKSKNPASYMFHTPNIDLVKLQAEALGIPLIEQETVGEKEKELEDLKRAIVEAKKTYKIEGIVTGALYSNYQRERIEKICDEVGLKIFSPLWHINQETELREILDSGFKFILSSIAAEGLDKSWLGREITAKDVDKLAMLNKKSGLNVAGEGGEYESLVVDGPIYDKKIEITDSEINEESKNTAFFVVKKAKLSDKSI